MLILFQVTKMFMFYNNDNIITFSAQVELEKNRDCFQTGFLNTYLP